MCKTTKTNGEKITITITKEHNEQLNDVVKHSNINALTKSAIVDVALANLFKEKSVDSIDCGIVNQIKGDS